MLRAVLVGQGQVRVLASCLFHAGSLSLPPPRLSVVRGVLLLSGPGVRS
jgi:hypothetical protein